MDLANQARGRWGEEEAARWYRTRGYEVVARNWRCRAGELDLVARIDRTVVFCEVKARRSDAFGIPALNYGPGEPNLAHQVGEYTRVDRLQPAEDALVAYLTDDTGSNA